MPVTCAVCQICKCDLWGPTLWLIDLDGFEDIRVGLHECLQGGCRWLRTRGAQGALLPWGPVVVGLRPCPAAMV